MWRPRIQNRALRKEGSAKVGVSSSALLILPAEFATLIIPGLNLTADQDGPTTNHRPSIAVIAVADELSQGCRQRVARKTRRIAGTKAGRWAAASHERGICMLRARPSV